LFLDIVSVGAERLHEITDEDARREGVADREAFAAKWREIYGAPGWDENPWVWRIGFRRVAPAPALAPSIATRLGPHCTEGAEETLKAVDGALKENTR
jgi:hypothetical protein